LARRTGKSRWAAATPEFREAVPELAEVWEGVGEIIRDSSSALTERAAAGFGAGEFVRESEGTVAAELSPSAAFGRFSGTGGFPAEAVVSGADSRRNSDKGGGSSRLAVGRGVSGREAGAGGRSGDGRWGALAVEEGIGRTDSGACLAGFGASPAGAGVPTTGRGARLAGVGVAFAGAASDREATIAESGVSSSALGDWGGLAGEVSMEAVAGASSVPCFLVAGSSDRALPGFRTGSETGSTEATV